MEFSQEEKNGFLIVTSQRADLGFWAVDLRELSRPRQVFRLVWELEAEVNNGGFHQYAHNGSGEGAPLCVGALQEIGASVTAGIVQRALEAIDAGIQWADWDARQESVAKLDETVLVKLDELDQAFFRYEDNLTDLLFAYVLRNIGDFPPPADI